MYYESTVIKTKMNSFIELKGKFKYNPILIVGEGAVVFGEGNSYRFRYLTVRGFKFKKDIVVSIELMDDYIKINRQHFDYTRGQIARPQMTIDPWDFKVKPGDRFMLDLEDSNEDVLFFDKLKKVNEHEQIRASHQIGEFH